MLKKIMIVSILSIILFISPSASATTFQNNQVVDTNKHWTVHFNQEIVLDNLSKQGIVVIDSQGNCTNITLNLGKDNKTIIVNPPSNGYKPGEKYKLTINKNLHSKFNTKINKLITLDFLIKKIPVIDFYDFQNEIPIYDTSNGSVIPSRMFEPNKVFYVRQKQYSMKNAIIFSDYNNDEYSYLDTYPCNNFTYLLNNNYKKLTGYYAVNDDIHVENPNLAIASLFGIAVDGDYKFTASAKRGDKPVYFEVDLTGVDKLTFGGGCQINTDVYDNSEDEKKLYCGGVLFDLKLEPDNNYINDKHEDSIINDNIVTFKDINLETAIRNSINKPIGQITKSDVENIQKLDLMCKNIHDLQGIENLTNLSDLNLIVNQVTNISPLKQLTNLEILDLVDNPISDSDVLSLQHDLPYCKISFFPLDSPWYRRNY